MKRITVDDDLKEKLLGFDEDIELCDQEGYVLARVKPSTPWNDPDNWVLLTPEITPEEIQRRLTTDEPTFTTQEVIEKLRSM